MPVSRPHFPTASLVNDAGKSWEKNICNSFVLKLSINIKSKKTQQSPANYRFGQVDDKGPWGHA